MIDAAVLRAMLAHGASAEMIVAAVDADQKDRQARLDARREKDRLRKRAYRESQRNQQPRPQGRHGTTWDTPSPDKENPPDPLKKLTPSPNLFPEEGNSQNGKSRSDPLPVQKAFENWNKIADTNRLPKALKLTEARRKQIRARLHEFGIDGWNEALWKIEGNKFFHGENDRGWVASLDFLLRPSKFAKVLEGGYEKRECEK